MGRIDKTEVLARVNLGELMTELLGAPKQSGRKLTWPSPTVAGTGKSPPCHIRGTNAAGVEFWHDFASGGDGNAIDLLMMVNPSTPDFKSALTFLAERVGVAAGKPLPPAISKSVSTHQPARPAGDEFRQWVDWCRAGLTETRLGAEALDWLTNKGFNADVVVAAGIGFDVGHWRSDEWPKQRRQRCGISNASGVVYPIRDAAGVIQYAQTRNLQWTPDSDYPKYFNPKGLINPHIGHWIGSATAGAPVVVVEGPSDGLAAWSASGDGDDFSVASIIGAGVAQRDDVVDVIAQRWPGHPIVVATDADVAGREAATALLNAFDGLGFPTIRLVPRGGDIADWQLLSDAFLTDFRRAVDAAVNSIEAGARVRVPRRQAAASSATVGFTG